jgi:hypothetical protein
MSGCRGEKLLAAGELGQSRFYRATRRGCGGLAVPNFRHRLTRTQQRIYDRSNAIASIPLRPTPRLLQAVQALPALLRSGDSRRVAYAAQAIADEIAGSLRVPRARIIVSGTRPSNARGELHGLYTPAALGTATINLWMITAKLGKVVAFKTFLRTLLHEVCHHLDYALLHLGDSLHTAGFYKRESSLFYQVGGALAAQAAAAQPGNHSCLQTVGKSTTDLTD